MPVRTVIERGPKEKRAVAFSPDWPGWSRGAKTPEAALDTLEAYRKRYRPVAVPAATARPVAHHGRHARRDAVEERPGRLQEGDPAFEVDLGHRPLLS